MSIELQIKDMIIEQYGSVAEFSTVAGIPNSSFSSLVKRGINTANMSTMLKLCDTLHISIDELARGQIVPTTAKSPHFGDDVASSLNLYKHALKSLENVNLDGVALSDNERDVLYAMLDGVVDVLRALKR